MAQDRITDGTPPSEFGPLCRLMREQAGISLRQMAERTHRDVSSLSRFERSQVTPRDLNALVSEYRLLRRPQQQAQQISKLRAWPFAYLGGTLAVVCVLLIIAPPGTDSDIMRAWAIASLVILGVCRGACGLAAYRQGNHPVASGNASYVAFSLALVLNGVCRWEQPLSPPVLVASIPAIMFGMIALARGPVTFAGGGTGSPTKG